MWILRFDFEGMHASISRSASASRNQSASYPLSPKSDLGLVDKGDSQKGQYLIQGSFWGGYLDPGFDERRGMGLP